MISVEKESNTGSYFHADTETSYVVKPLTAKRYAAANRKHATPNGVDYVKRNSELAVELIESWNNVEEDCTPENRAKFGEKFAIEIMPGIIEKAMDLATASEQEVLAAKKG